MPKIEQHLEQYMLNKKLLSESIFAIDSSEHLDWVLTIAFYCAVHLIEKQLAIIGFHNRNHEDRKNIIFKIKELKNISTQYVSLEVQSRRARYHCTKINKKDVFVALEYLEDIEKVAIPS